MEYNSLKITNEEKEALQTYCGYEHKYINLLISGDIEAVSKFNDKGNDKGIDVFSTKYFLRGMDTLNKIYSAMVKYSYDGNALGNVVRGTTLSEIDYINKNNGMCNKLLSTTTSELTAKQHGGSKLIIGQDDKDKTNVILRIRPTDKSLMYIDVNSVLQEESKYEREEEFIIAPFSRLTDIKHVSSWDGYEYYSADIEGQKLEKVENQGDVFRYISENIGDILEFVRLYKKNKDQYESFKDIMSYEKDEESIKLLEDKMDTALKDMKEIESKFNSFREKIIECAKGICYQTKERLEKEVKTEKMQLSKENSAQSRQDLSNSLDTIRQSVEAIGIQSSKYERMAKEFDIPWDTGISQENIAQLYNEIQEASEKFSDKLTDNLTPEEADKLQNRVSKITEWSNEIKTHLDNEYDDNSCLKQIKQELNDKIDDLIKQSKIQKMDEEIKQLEEEKVGVIGRILGRKNKIELKKKQLILRRELLKIESKPEQEPEQEDVNENEMLAKILYYRKENNGELPNSLETILFQMKKTFEIDDKEVATIMAAKAEQTALIPVSEKMAQSKNQNNSTLKIVNAVLEKRLEVARQESSEQYRKTVKCVGSATSVPEAIWKNMKSIDYTLKNEEATPIELHIDQQFQ